MQISQPLHRRYDSMYFGRASGLPFTLLNVLFTVLLITTVAKGGSPAQTPDPKTPVGVVIEEIAPDSPAEKAGLHVGDILLYYGDRPVNSPFAFMAAEENLVGIPTLTVKAIRGSQLLELPMHTAEKPDITGRSPLLQSPQTGLTVRPPLSHGVLSLYRAGQANANAKHWAEAIEQWKAALKASETIENKSTSAWLCALIAIGHASTASGSDPSMRLATASFLRAWEYVKEGDDKAAQTNLQMDLGKTHLGLFDPLGAVTWFEQAYPIAVACNDEIWAADILDFQGLIALSQCTPEYNSHIRTDVALQQMAKAAKLINEALKIRTRLAPNSVKMATSLTYLASVTQAQGDYVNMQMYYQRACAILRKIAPLSGELASVLTQLGIAAELQGELSEARDRIQEALRVSEKWPADLSGVPNLKAEILSHLARVVSIMGDLNFGQECARKALEISAALPPNQRLYEVTCFMTLGQTFATQGDLVNAQRQLEQGLSLCRKAGQPSIEMGITLDCLAMIAFAQGDLDHAEKYCIEAERVWQRMFLGSPEGRAACLNVQGMIAFSRGETKVSQDRFQQALALWKKSPISSSGLPVSLNGLGNIAVANGDLTSAEKYYQEELTFFKKRAQGGSVVAACLNSLGNVHLLRHEPVRALPFYEGSVKALESERKAILDLDTRALYMQQNSSPYDGLLETYLALNHPDKAFLTLERSHARSFAEKVSERQQDPTDKLSSNLSERQKKLDNQRHIASTALLRARTKQDKQAEKTADRSLEELAATQRQLDADIRSIHPRFYPQPIDLKTAQDILPSGTLVLAYAITGQKVHLFTLTRNTIHPYTLPLSRKRLEEEVIGACKIITNINSLPEKYEQVLQNLYKDLLKPAQHEITAARSLLICPDGPLSRLPFAALMPSPGHFLIERKPLAVVASLTVYKNLLDTRFPTNPTVLVLGHPLAPGRESLPQTRTLALEIDRLYAPHSTRLLDKDATIANLKSKCGRAGVLYLGCHSEADNRNPFGSYLALTPGSGDNGLLYAWQVLGIKMKANLVVLGACQTGLGADAGFEGVQGLARAFQIAGADDVLMTLWKVRDGPAARLLQDFFNVWKRTGSRKPMAVALQEAQIHAIHSDPRPYLWASFVLNGVGR